jgi:hypothetical protein
MFTAHIIDITAIYRKKKMATVSENKENCKINYRCKTCMILNRRV